MQIPSTFTCHLFTFLQPSWSGVDPWISLSVRTAPDWQRLSALVTAALRRSRLHSGSRLCVLTRLTLNERRTSEQHFYNLRGFGENPQCSNPTFSFSEDCFSVVFIFRTPEGALWVAAMYISIAWCRPNSKVRFTEILQTVHHSFRIALAKLEIWRLSFSVLLPLVLLKRRYLMSSIISPGVLESCNQKIFPQ